MNQKLHIMTFECEEMQKDVSINHFHEYYDMEDTNKQTSVYLLIKNNMHSCFPSLGREIWKKVSNYS